tara:strand:+ start:675 stop:1376 length:702 start_codon:yes stop_codon:yes gene_type:complete
MKSDFINIGLISKGRMMESAQKIFKKNKLKIYKRSGERDLFGYIKDIKFQNVRIWYLSPKEIIESVGTGVLDAGIGALDLLKNSEPNIQSRISIEKKYDFGQCQLCVLLPKFWLDTVNPTDLEEVSWEFFYKKKRLMRIATKFKLLTEQWCKSRGINMVEIIGSEGATEAAPRLGKADLVVDVATSFDTAKANNLKLLEDDGVILNSSAILCSNKNSIKKREVKKFVKLLSKN